MLDKKTIEFYEKPTEYVIGRLYHCSWATKRGYVWKLVSFDANKDVAEMITPKSRKKMVTKLSSLVDTNKTIINKINSKKQ